MIEHVWRAASQCPRMGTLTIATGDTEVARSGRQFGATVHVDDAPYRNGTERSAGASGSADIVVVIQADQPGLNPAHLTLVIDELIESRADMTTLGTPLVLPSKSPHVVKCLADRNGRALDFIRAPIEHAPDTPAYRHLGVYAYTREALERYVALGPHARERQEDLEQLRALEAGFDIRIVKVHEACPAVDTPAGVELAERWISQSGR